MEKETTGLYLTGHPMDDYRELARQNRASPIGAILVDFDQERGPEVYRDGQKVTLAGVVAGVKTKTTRNNTLMAYVTLEDDTGSMELLCFSRTLAESGPFLAEGMAVLVEGKLSVRDEKAPQLMCDRVRPLTSQMAEEATQRQSAPGGQAVQGTLYVKVPSAEDPLLRKARLVLNMFPGAQRVILLCADTRKQLGASAQLHPALLAELREMFGPENVVVK